jgi:hypothetical protein
LYSPEELAHLGDFSLYVTLYLVEMPIPPEHIGMVIHGKHKVKYFLRAPHR